MCKLGQKTSIWHVGASYFWQLEISPSPSRQAYLYSPLVCATPLDDCLLTNRGLGVVIYALGNGFNAVVRSLVTQIVEPDQIGRLSAVISLVDTVGAILSGPFLAATYRWGLALGGPWIGMPFLTTGGLFVLTLVAVLMVRMNKIRDY